MLCPHKMTVIVRLLGTGLKYSINSLSEKLDIISKTDQNRPSQKHTKVYYRGFHMPYSVYYLSVHTYVKHSKSPPMQQYFVKS